MYFILVGIVALLIGVAIGYVLSKQKAPQPNNLAQELQTKAESHEIYQQNVEEQLNQLLDLSTQMNENSQALQDKIMYSIENLRKNDLLPPPYAESALTTTKLDKPTGQRKKAKQADKPEPPKDYAT